MEQEKSGSGTIIKSFYIPGEEGISEYWRRNKSSVVALELARLLSSLRRLTGYLGMNVGSIIWQGMKPPEETSAIILDPTLVRGKYPIPASKTDHVVGIAVREAYRRIEWGEKALSLAGEKAGKMGTGQKYKFHMFLEMAERIYMDMYANRTVLGLYAEVARQNEFKKAKNNFLPPPSVEELLYYWWLKSADKNGTRQLHEYYALNHEKGAFAELTALYAEPVHMLDSFIRQKFAACMRKSSVLERCHYRSDIYVEIWCWLSEAIKLWPVDHRSVMMEEEGLLFAVPQITPRISDDTLKAIEQALAENVDFTYEVRRICEEDTATVTIKTGNILMPMEEKLDRQLYLYLKAALRLRSRRRNVISHGLKSGSIDPRRLYRAALTGEVFMYKKPVFDMDNDVTLLVDASSSMVGPKWKNSQRVFFALYEALKEINKNTRVFAYNEAFDICYLTELSCNDRLYTVVPRGKTASGEAIIAVALMLKKRNRYRKPMIIHLTDGASNWGSEVKYAIDHCKKENIGLITIGLGCNKINRTDLQKEYGEQVRFIDDIKTLPRKFTELINTTRM